MNNKEVKQILERTELDKYFNNSIKVHQPLSTTI